MNVIEAASIMGIAKSTYYFKPTGKKKGKKPSAVTCKADGTMVDNSQVLEEIKKVLSVEFLDYGYKLTTHHLKQEDYVINKKKVYRIMKEAKLLHPRVKKGQSIGKQYIEFTVPALDRPFSTVEIDIKYIFIHGERRNAFLITFICTFSRYAGTWGLDYTMKANQVADLLQQFTSDPVIRYYIDKNNSKFTIRTDNGPQFVAKLLAKEMKKQGLNHEFIHPATPQENAHIESFHNTVERLVQRRYEFDDLDHAKTVFMNFYHTYNNIRIMAALCNNPPVKFLKLWEEGYVGIKLQNKKQIFFLREKPTNKLLVDLSPEELFVQNKFNTLNNRLLNLP